MQDEFSGFRERISSVLGAISGIQLRSMFGGFGVVKDGQLIGLLYRDHLYLRTRPETRAQFESRGMREYRAFGAPAKKLTGFMQVPDEVVGDASALRQWTSDAAGETPTGSPQRHELPHPIRRRR